jgi:hypothetical protein
MMRHADFTIGGIFWCGDRQWRCTDIGTRTIIAMCIAPVEVSGASPEMRRTLTRAEADAEGWFNGPLYAVAERVFDEDDIMGCSLTPQRDAGSSS